MKQPDSRELQRQSDFEPGNCLRGLVSLEKERGAIQTALRCSTKIEFSWYDLTSGIVLSLGSLMPEFYTVQNLIVVGATVFSKT